MTEWRPPNFKNPYHRDLEYNSSELYPATWRTMEETYEAGADAMLGEICALTDGTHIMIKLFRDSKGKINIVKYP